MRIIETQTLRYHYTLTLTLADAKENEKSRYIFKFFAKEKIEKKDMYRAFINNIMEITYHIPTKTLRIYNIEGNKQIELVVDPERSNEEALVHKIMDMYHNGFDSDKHLALTVSSIPAITCILAILFNETIFTD